MRFGLNFVNGGSLCEREPAIQLAELADELQFASMWVGDHVVIPVSYTSRYPEQAADEVPFDHDTAFGDAASYLSFLAGITSTVRLATGVLVLAQHNPLEVAKAFATVDSLSGGRVTLGIGTGWLREEFEALGVSFDDRLARTLEGIEVMRRLWAGPGASYSGTHFSLDALTCSPRPVQPGGIPIFLGGYTNTVARRAGRIANGHYPGFASVERVREMRREIERGAADVGRNPDEIETVLAAPYDSPLTVEVCKEYEAAGVSELLIMVPHAGNYPVEPVAPDWFDRTRRALHEFRSEIMEQFR